MSLCRQADGRIPLICNECEESQAFPKDIVELETTLGIPREELMADMERGKRCILCGSVLEQAAVAQAIERDSE